MSVGADLKYSDIDRLRYEYEDDVNAVLTAKTSEDFDKEIRKWRAKDYSWAKNTGDLLDKIRMLKQQVAERDEIIEAQTEKLRTRKHMVDPLILVKKHKKDKRKSSHKKGKKR